MIRPIRTTASLLFVLLLAPLLVHAAGAPEPAEPFPRPLDAYSVPAGAYARDWLRARGAWDRLQSHLATAADVRAVRTFVARGEADLGVVYRSDAVKADQVRVVAQPPADQQPSIRYPAAVVTGAQAGAAEFLAYLSGAKAQAVFRTWGFTALS